MDDNKELELALTIANNKHDMVALNIYDRITSYNVCYTKLLRNTSPSFHNEIFTSPDESEITTDTASNNNSTTKNNIHFIYFFRITSYNVCYTKLLRKIGTYKKVKIRPK